MARTSIRSSSSRCARFREFLREPEAVFWVFAFPGDHDLRARRRVPIARRGAGRSSACVEQAGGDGSRGARAAGGFTVRRDRARRRRARGARRARAGGRRAGHRRRRIASTRRAPRARWRGWPWTRRCSARRAAPMRSRRAQQPVDAVGSRYIDWLVPGLLGMNIMGTGLWGVGFSIVQARTRKLLKRLVATPMSQVALPAVARAQPPGVPRARSRVSSASRWLAFDVRRARLAAGRWRRSACSARSPSAGSACSSRAARGRSRRCRG